MIRVLVVEDSATAREFLLHILSSDPAIEVVGTAQTGEEAIEAVQRTRPDLITMDVDMPRMNGFDATRRIMETNPTPIVIVSGSADAADTANALRAIESGAVAVLRKPSGVGSADYEHSSSQLISALKVMSEVKVVRRWPRYRSVDIDPLSAAPIATEFSFQAVHSHIRIVAIGASTGGPPVLQTILAGLPGTFPVPVLIVQHMAAGFTQSFVDWLALTSSLPVHIPTQGELALPGHAYIAPDGLQMSVSAEGGIQLKADQPENGLRPSVACLFRSVAKAYGHDAAGVLLTGMGKDGAAELKLMKEQGAVTIAQDQDTSVVHGMPGEAIKLGGATYVLPPDKIRLALTSLTIMTAGNNGRSMANGHNGLSEIKGLFLGCDLSGR